MLFGTLAWLLVDRAGSAGTPVATREEILRAAERAAGSVGSDGTLWVVFIGHGAPSKDEVRFLGTDAGRSAEGFEVRGIARSELLQALESRADATVAVLDTCFSGQGATGEALLDKPLMPALLTSLVEEADTIELLATSRDQYAGPLPGATRPAFSYLVLGALRGWGDEAVGATRDGTVTAEEAVTYARETLNMLVRGRVQEPTYHTSDDGLLARALGAGAEPSPDRSQIRRALYGEGGS